MTLLSFSMTFAIFYDFQAWKMVFLYSMTFHDQGAPCRYHHHHHHQWKQHLFRLNKGKVAEGPSLITGPGSCHHASMHKQHLFGFLIINSFPSK